MSDLLLLGDEELLAALKELDYKTQHKFLKKVVSDSANIYVKAARRRVPIRTTKLYPPSVTRQLHPTLGRSGKKRARWHPPGAGRKSISKKAGKSKRVATVFVGPRTNTGDKKTDGWYLKFGEYGTGSRPGHFWFRIAYATNKNKVEKNMIVSVRKIIERAWAKKVKRGTL